MSEDSRSTQDTFSVSETLGQETHRTKSIKYRRWAILGVILLLIVGAYLYFASTPKPQFTYKTAKIQRGDIALTVTAAGTLQPLNQVQVGSEISGLIQEVLVDYNDVVKKGQILAKLDTDQLRAKYLQSEASLQLSNAKLTEAQTTLKESRQTWLRTQELEKTQMSSKEQRDAAEASYLRARAGVASAKAQVVLSKALLDSDKTLLEKTNIRAPINGIVLSRNVEPGQTVAASFQTPVLFTLAEDLSRMELHVDVDEADIGVVKAGQKATFTVDAYPHRTFNAKIVKVYFAPKVVQDVVTYEALLQVDNKDMALLPGMTATADIVSKESKDVLLVPNAALRFSPTETTKTTQKSRSSVWRTLLPGPPPHTTRQQVRTTNGHNQTLWILENGELTSIPVKTGITNGRESEIFSDKLKEGQAVVTDAIRVKK